MFLLLVLIVMWYVYGKDTAEWEKAFIKEYENMGDQAVQLKFNDQDHALMVKLCTKKVDPRQLRQHPARVETHFVAFKKRKHSPILADMIRCKEEFAIIHTPHPKCAYILKKGKKHKKIQGTMFYFEAKVCFRKKLPPRIGYSRQVEVDKVELEELAQQCPPTDDESERRQRGPREYEPSVEEQFPPTSTVDGPLLYYVQNDEGSSEVRKDNASSKSSRQPRAESSTSGRYNRREQAVERMTVGRSFSVRERGKPALVGSSIVGRWSNDEELEEHSPEGGSLENHRQHQKRTSYDSDNYSVRSASRNRSENRSRRFSETRSLPPSRTKATCSRVQTDKSEKKGKSVKFSSEDEQRDYLESNNLEPSFQEPSLPKKGNKHSLKSTLRRTFGLFKTDKSSEKDEAKNGSGKLDKSNSSRNLARSEQKQTDSQLNESRGSKSRSRNESNPSFERQTSPNLSSGKGKFFGLSQSFNSRRGGVEKRSDLRQQLRLSKAGASQQADEVRSDEELSEDDDSPGSINSVAFRRTDSRQGFRRVDMADSFQHRNNRSNDGKCREKYENLDPYLDGGSSEDESSSVYRFRQLIDKKGSDLERDSSRKASHTRERKSVRGEKSDIERRSHSRSDQFRR